MRVFKPQIVQDGDKVCVSARVSVDSARTKFPGELWFRFPVNCQAYVASDLNAFAVALLPLAMTLGEDLILEGAVSPRLLWGMMEYQRLQCAWKPTNFKPVGIRPDRLQAARQAAWPGPAGNGVGCSFSAGVDSFHTLWNHLPQNEALQQHRITTCLMINGFDADSDLEDRGHFAGIQRSVEPVVKSLGIDLVVCKTNYMCFSDPAILKQSFGAMVTVPALALGQLFSRFYVPSSYRFDEFFRDGSHPILDHLIGSETMETVHDSSYLDRPAKTKVIAGWEATHSTLRVCSNATGYRSDSGSIQNCGRCEKCVRTMKTLEILQRRDDFSTFARKAGRVDVWKCYFGQKGARIHAREVMAAAWKARRFGIWTDYLVAIGISFVIKVPRELSQRVHLFLEERSGFYATHIRRLFPRLRRRAHWIR